MTNSAPTSPSHTAIEAIARVTHGTRFHGRLYTVGGFLRDEYLGRPEAQDIDLVLEGDAIELAEFLCDERVAQGRPVTYPRFGTAMIRVQGSTVELVTARREFYSEQSRKPDVEPATIREDALRRDFTINTLFRSVHTGDISDPTGLAIKDLNAGIIRTPLAPDQTFFDDPLRMLRAVRFAVQLSFVLDPAASESIRAHAARLKVISRERIRDEWNKLILSPRPALGLQMLRELALLQEFLPEASSLEDGRPGAPWAHTLRLLELAPGSLSLSARLAMALHHTEANPARLLRDLRYSTAIAAEVGRLLDLRRQVAAGSEWSDGSLRRLVRQAGDLLDDFRVLCQLDQQAGDLAGIDLVTMFRRISDLEAQQPSGPIDSPLTGLEIMELLELQPGREVRDAKDILLNEVLEGRLNPADKAAAARWLMAHRSALLTAAPPDAPA